MSAARDRKEAAKRLGVALGAQCRRMLEASGQEEITRTSMECGELFLENMEFIVWILKEYGGVQQMPFQPIRPALVTKQDLN